jgi:hypothetical protein
MQDMHSDTLTGLELSYDKYFLIFQNVFFSDVKKVLGISAPSARLIQGA